MTAIRKSRVRWLRRALIKLAMWGDPEARLPDGLHTGYAAVDSARAGCLEDRVMLARAFYALRYLRGVVSVPACEHVGL